MKRIQKETAHIYLEALSVHEGGWGRKGNDKGSRSESPLKLFHHDETLSKLPNVSETQFSSSVKWYSYYLTHRLI